MAAVRDKSCLFLPKVDKVSGEDGTILSKEKVILNEVEFLFDRRRRHRHRPALS